MHTLAFQLLQKDTLVKINTSLPSYSVIRELLLYHVIPVENFDGIEGKKVTAFDMGFTSDCTSLEVFLFAEIFKDFGLTHVYLQRSIEGEGRQVTLGKCIYDMKNPESYALTSPRNTAGLYPHLSMEEMTRIFYPTTYFIREETRERPTNFSDYLLLPDSSSVEDDYCQDTGPDYYKWLSEEFGDDAETAFWNTD